MELREDERRLYQIADVNAEEERLRVLNDLHVLDSPAEDRFDRLTMLCQLLFDVPIAAITLIDRRRQWFKSKRGLDLEETRREDAFCNVTIQHPNVFVVDHASTDPHFAENPYVLGAPNIEFYAGYPLEVQGQRLGALCIMDREAHSFTAEQKETLKDLALWVQTELQRDEERERATEVHRAMMPAPLAPIEGYQLAGLCVPSRAVGGDYYNWRRNDAGQLEIVLADVMGKGVAAAVIMATVRAALMTVARRDSMADSIADVAHAIDADLTHTGSYVTLFKARVTTETGEVSYVDAGLGLATITRADGTFSRLNTRGLPLGVDVDATWPVGHATLSPGDTLLVASDGLWEMMGGDAAARDEIIRRVHEHADLNEGIHSLLADARPDRARDDITIVAVRRNPLS
ncbi:MAG: SpoIIE family protein phosphatase [Acidobacteriota bacterium]|nr:SpoIIE family protein phosphatase [Acidobacteriota bacterium]MDE3107539.1 SpoIIE family protein phosphatase [Acidobacteriota bacterium]